MHRTWTIFVKNVHILHPYGISNIVDKTSEEENREQDEGSDESTLGVGRGTICWESKYSEEEIRVND